MIGIYFTNWAVISRSKYTQSACKVDMSGSCALKMHIEQVGRWCWFIFPFNYSLDHPVLPRFFCSLHSFLQLRKLPEESCKMVSCICNAPLPYVGFIHRRWKEDEQADRKWYYTDKWIPYGLCSKINHGTTEYSYEIDLRCHVFRKWLLLYVQNYCDAIIMRAGFIK